MNTADVIAYSLETTANAYHYGEITHADLGERNRADWDEAEAAGVADDVREVLRWINDHRTI